MAPHVVGLLGHTGRTGSVALKVINQGHISGKLVLVILHRPGSDLSTVPVGIETREVDLSKPDQGQIKAAVEGLNVLM